MSKYPTEAPAGADSAMNAGAAAIVSKTAERRASQSREEAWTTDGAWISGLAGALAVFLIAYWFWLTDALSQGFHFAGYQLTDNRMDTVLAALILVALVMLSVEAVRLWQRQGRGYLQVAPELQRRRYGVFAARAIADYLSYLCIWWLAIQFFWWANEYGYQRNASYYQGWFRMIELAWWAAVWLGPPYILLTRAFRHDAPADRRDLPALLWHSVTYAASWAPGCRSWRKPFTEDHKKATRALMVKLFFAPLMTVFFLDQFPHLVSNVGYLFNQVPALIGAGNYSHARFNGDLFNISVAAIFSVDVALAWCGYAFSSRWVDNHTRSVEPTMLGWVVCLVCYPPFQMFLGLYFSAPAERDVLNLGSLWLVTLFTGMMILSYLIYMISTLCFGVRFSNLTHRGIIRTGPYAFVRHPAYASKNFAWWCLMFPVVLWNGTQVGWSVAVLQILGLVLMTWVYYMRALTEERHLSRDPRYLEYCKQVKYRFIPGIL